ncbi:MAG TPA: hypothetical protein VFE25_01305 [Opitutaceae bacterium]|jgi:hypothetical protein|nr:hypothetical protein [Opitutaceae bacterium]
MVIDLDPPTYFAQFATAHTAAPAKRVLRTHAQASTSRLSREEHEAQFEREHGSLWTPGLLDRLSLPLSRIHE